MKNNIKTITFAIISLLTFNSCNDDFLETTPNNKLVIDKVYKTSKDFDVAVIGCYSKLQTQVDFYTEFSEFRSDNLMLTAPTTGTQDRYDIDHFVDRPSNGLLSKYWAIFNNNVYRCNLILDRIDQANFDESLKKQYKAEAMFVRALVYFNMYRVWGGVSVTRKVVTPSEALKIKRSTDDEMLKFIAGDLKMIIDDNMLPEKYDNVNVGRATSGAARALLGKVYLTFHKNTEAVNVLTPLVNKYQLLENPLDIFDVNNKTNDEIIFSVRFNKDILNEGHNYWFHITNRKDENYQVPSLKQLYTDDDKRKPLLLYEQAEKRVYLMNKFMDIKNESYKQVGNDQILIRYADVLLSLAEALNEISYNEESVKYLNEVRVRAGLEALTTSELSNQELIKKMILDERHREFPYEGHRWFDLVRMGYAKQIMKKAQDIDVKDYQLLFPIPQSEIEKINDDKILWQNPGY
ncbi:RagB/SusD family nutrient uptake outer membrane protein [Ornithobacterium rhinotracheale]|uniref:RagB/SusD family nutrient uptake outer membrane protein n=1 Tax=Ornithobacterium rhinotracheale TaxID=28251 RepID=UPI00129CD1E3|nr:RagB/SusD family nutrient uptake outer membrane protein [Ornithobacterium rhinotracheale]MRI63765.1 RagB/SusD family nutrient uptake outer membrane protein [Ornithobacterium rhinotracheale]